MAIIKKPALILDRDGVVIQRPFLTWKKNQVRLSRGVARGIRFFNANKIPVIVITNQPVVARGLISEKGVEKIHKLINARLYAKKAWIDAFYFCPHHPEATVKKYRFVCACRKPAIGLFQRAAKEFAINLAQSVMIGDMTQDILAGKRAGLKTILTKTGYGGKDNKYAVTPDYQAISVAAALRIAQDIIIKKGGGKPTPISPALQPVRAR